LEERLGLGGTGQTTRGKFEKGLPVSVLGRQEKGEEKIKGHQNREGSYLTRLVEKGTSVSEGKKEKAAEVSNEWG